MTENKVEDLIKRATKNNLKIMGDDFIGYKIIGENSHLWNDSLESIYQSDEGFILNANWLESIGVHVFEYEGLTWMANSRRGAQ